MKRKKRSYYISAVLGDKDFCCDKCLHTRVGEPYIVRCYVNEIPGGHDDCICWRCCRDAESTFLIHQKWPLAFDVVIEGNYHRLEWSSGVKALIGNRDEVQTSD